MGEEDYTHWLSKDKGETYWIEWNRLNSSSDYFPPLTFTCQVQGGVFKCVVRTTLFTVIGDQEN